jgi:hypothetical protein
MLKIHFKTSYHCLLNDEQIYAFFNPNINIIKCNICLQVFSQKCSLYRHQRNVKCNKNQDRTNTQPNTPSNLSNPSTTPSNPSTPSTIPPNNISNQINNLTNSHNTINNNIINNTINNTINIQHINPFGFEDVRTIPIPEMKTILSSGENSGLQIIKAIYNKIENKNFYKPNMNRPEIACLNTDFNLTIYKCKEFCDALFDRCIAFLHHMLYLCKNEYSKSSIKNIYDNIEYIETTMRTEIYDKKLQNIIESEFRNNNLDNKDRIKKFIKEIKDNSESKEQSTSLVNNTLSLANDSNKEYKISITEEELNKVFGDPKVIIGLNKQEFIEEFHIKRFEETKLYKFWTDRIKNESIYINKSKTATIGDIKNMKFRKTKIELMLNIIEARADSTPPGDLINLDVEGFTYEQIEDDEIVS